MSYQLDRELAPAMAALAAQAAGTPRPARGDWQAVRAAASNGLAYMASIRPASSGVTTTSYSTPTKDGQALYYDRRVDSREPGSQNVFNYFVGLGVDANLDTINSELREISRCLGELTAMSFLDLGVGPNGTFTLQLPGRGSALDQSDAALRRLRAVSAELPLVRAHAMRLPVRNKAFGRVFIRSGRCAVRSGVDGSAILQRMVPAARHLLRARDLADARYHEPLTVVDLAGAAGLSPAHFSREFRRTFGEAPHQYLLTRRLERAAALLRNTDRTVTEISFAVGLISVGSFTTSFRRVYGTAPLAYRASFPPAQRLIRIPDCIARAYGRPENRTFREAKPSSRP